MALPFGLMGLVGACLTADFYRLRLSGDGRGLLLLLIPVAGALLGMVLSARAVARRGWATWLLAIVGTIALGMAISVGVSVVVWGSLRHVVGTMAEGASTALAFVPVVGTMTWLARRVGRARPGSLVDESDRRAPWIVVATGTALAMPLVERGSFVYPAGIETSAALGYLAVGALAMMFVIDLAMTNRARVAVRALATMRERPAGLETTCDDIVDLGLGDEEYEELVGAGSAYRTNERPMRIVRGDPLVAFAAMRASAVRSGLCAAAALLAVLTSNAMVHGTTNGLYGWL